MGGVYLVVLVLLHPTGQALVGQVPAPAPHGRGRW